MKKIAILGKLQSKFNAPFNNPDYEIWTMNKHVDMDKIPRIDLIFDIHSNFANEKADITKDNYPFNDAINLVGGKYFNNSVSYMIAYAILKGYKEIALFGMRFDAAHEIKRNGEYQNVRELIFFAKGKGIKITSFDDEMLKEYPMYG